MNGAKPKGTKPPRVLFTWDDATPALLGELFLELERIIQAEADTDPATAERCRARDLIYAFSKFIGRSSWNSPARNEARRFLHLFAARLERLNEGERDPVFITKGKPGRRKEADEIWTARIYVCAALECYMRKGKLSRAAAARSIAVKKPILKRLMWNATEATASKSTPKQLEAAILAWHDRLQQGEASAEIWPIVLNTLDHGGQQQPWIERARYFLTLARDATGKVVLPAHPEK
jgi:hypothetical protein